MDDFYQAIERFVLAYPADGTCGDRAHDPYGIGGMAEKDHAWHVAALLQFLAQTERRVVGKIAV